MFTYFGLTPKYFVKRTDTYYTHSGGSDPHNPNNYQKVLQNGMTTTTTVIQAMLALLGDNTNYMVSHKWKWVDALASSTSQSSAGQANAGGGNRGRSGLRPHHSQIFINKLDGSEVVNFGLFQDPNKDVKFMDFDNTRNIVWHLSSSYDKNGQSLTCTGDNIAKAFIHARHKCGTRYDLRYNNCQKFARIYMGLLGSKHSFTVFHI